MDEKDKMTGTDPMDEEIEARLRRTDFSSEDPALMGRLWMKIQFRIRDSENEQDQSEDIDLTSEEMSMLTAARGNPFAGIGDFSANRKKPLK